MKRYLAVKEGWDGRRLIPAGTVFNFDGPKGSWMVEVDENNKPIKGADVPAPQRPVRLGAKESGGQSRDDLRKQCKDLGIKFPATAGAPALAELVRKHYEELEKVNQVVTSPENPDGGAPGLGQGTANQEVL